MSREGDKKMGGLNLESGEGSGSVEVSAVDRILDLPLMIHVELGHRRMRVDELLQIAVGSVVERSEDRRASCRERV